MIQALALCALLGVSSPAIPGLLQADMQINQVAIPGSSANLYSGDRWSLHSEESFSFGHQTDFQVGGYHPGPGGANEVETLHVPACENQMDQKSTIPKSAVCVWDDRNFVSHLQFFPHAAQNILPCWSQVWMADPTARPILLMRGGTGAKIRDGNSWTREMLEKMGVTVIDAESDPKGASELCGPNILQMTHLAHTHKVSMAEGKATSSKAIEHDIEWLKSPYHATKLREKVLGDLLVDHPPTDGRLRVGILDRHEGDGRHIVHAEELRQAVSDLDQVAYVDLATFDNMTASQQALWMTNHDIILAAHGAALTNIMFSAPCTVVLDMFPKTYFWPTFYSTLATEVGLEYFWMYPGSAEQALKYSPLNTPDWGKKGRASNIDFRVEEILRVIPEMFNSRLNCLSFGQSQILVTEAKSKSSSAQ